MVEKVQPNSPIRPSTADRQNELGPTNNQKLESILDAILQTMLFMATIHTRQVAYQLFDKVFPQEGKEVPRELGTLLESMESLKNSIEVLENDSAPVQALDHAIELLVSLQEVINREIEEEAAPEVEEPTLRFFSILEEPDDLWGIVRRCDELFSRYSHLSHLALPFFWREAIVELHKHNTGDTVLAQRAIELPGIELETIIGKLLREAPCSGLLQVLKRRFESSLEMAQGVLVLPEDKSNIREAVRKYIEDIEKFQEGKISAEELRRKVDYDLKNYNFGGGDMETRIPKVAYDVANNLLRSAKALPPRDERLPYMLNAVSFIVALNQIIVESSNLSVLLKVLKV
ncbi:MAG: hypothetical protein ACE5OZ_19215 [Candidatus Heimdallarchaeota archaeon]